MDYFLTTILFLFGVGFYCMQVVMSLRKTFPQFGFSAIWKTFFNEEWDSLMVSGLVLAVQETGLFIIVYNEVKIPTWLDDWGMYGLALVLGYAGQRIAYKYLGTAADALQEKADQLKSKIDRQ